MTDAATNPTTREEIEAMHRADAWTPPQLLARLDELGLDTSTHEHDPMWTVEDSQRLREDDNEEGHCKSCLLYTSPSPRDLSTSRMPSSA